MKTLIEIGKDAKKSSRELAKLSTMQKNEILVTCADYLIKNTASIVEANKADLDKAEQNGITGALADRLMLDEKRVAAIAEGLNNVAKLDDPIGEVLSMKTLPNGLVIGQKRVPIGVIGIIYESRPNVTSDAFGLCFKAGSACILRGGKEAINSNIAIVAALKKAIESLGFDSNFVQLLHDTSRETASEMMKLNGYIDVLIPRGGSGLINSVVMNSTVPVIETGSGNCHVYVDENANINDAINIIINAKSQRPGVCNAAETLLVHKNISEDFLPKALDSLKAKNVELRGCNKTSEVYEDVIHATEEDYAMEFHDYILAVKVVESLDEAIEHISTYSTGHSECIVTENYTNAKRFTEEVDSAAVYVNASTRFTDGDQFGFGAEIGISTQKLHARGPMGLKEMTTSKYIIFGNGQVRN